MVIRNFALPVLIALGGSVAGLLAVGKDAGLYWPYSLMIMGMNSNRTEDVMAGGIWGFFLSCAVFLAVFLLISNVLLTKRDVEA